MALNKQHYIGLMSGTSLDGIDGVLVQYSDDKIQVLQHAERRYSDSLREAFAALLSPANNEIVRIEQAGHERNRLALELVEQLCSGIDRKSVRAIADHGQTIRHCPDAKPAYTLQVHRAAELAEHSGIDCIVDFRSKDIAAGGQGAPLVPAFHQAYFAGTDQYRIVVNIGGLANISVLGPKPEHTSIGFDTGPGNTLLDSWCLKQTGAPYDQDGQWAASGKMNPGLLSDLMSDPYFQQASPKSTGREYFNLSWLERMLESGRYKALSLADIQASLAALTAASITLGIQQACELSGIRDDSLEGVYVCGGGAHNLFLMQQLTARIPAPVLSSTVLGIPPQQVEAVAFSWLGKQAIEGTPVELQRTTGARHNNILGTVYRT